MKTVTPEVLAVLGSAEIDGHLLRLTGQLDRKLYVATNKVLEAAGGKWDRSAKGHVFDGDPSDTIESILLTRTFTDARREFDAYYTPPSVVDAIMAAADIREGMLVLEPSMGAGALVVPALNAGASVVGYELRPDTGCGSISPARLEAHVGVDFLTVEPERRFDRVLMNPPFSRQQDMAHVIHAWRFLASPGRLVAVMSPAFEYRTTEQAVAFRDLYEYADGVTVELPPASFRSVGTDVVTRLVILEHE